MAGITPKRIHNPIPPEYANVFVLKAITLIVGIICLLLTSYATWIVYSMSNRIAAYQTSLEIEAAVRKIAPIDFHMLDRVITIDTEKQTFTLRPLTHDVFYTRVVTSTEGDVPKLPLNQSSSSLPTSSTTHL